MFSPKTSASAVTHQRVYWLLFCVDLALGTSVGSGGVLCVPRHFSLVGCTPTSLALLPPFATLGRASPFLCALLKRWAACTLALSHSNRHTHTRTDTYMHTLHTLSCPSPILHLALRISLSMWHLCVFKCLTLFSPFLTLFSIRAPEYSFLLQSFMDVCPWGGYVCMCLER